MKIKRKIILLFAIVVCLFGTLYSSDFIFADRDLEIDYPTAPSDPYGDPVVTPDTTKTTLPEYIKYLFNFLIGIGGILAFAVFVYGGVMWTFSAGNPGIIGPAKKKMINGMMGLALLLCSYLIIYTINPDLTVLRLGMIWESNIGPEYTPTEIGPEMYQEIPIGLLVEDILAKNISCFDKDKNLIDCRTKDIIDEPIDDIFDRDSHYNYCYEYDDEGNKEKLNDYHDRMDCIKELSLAMKIKSEKLRILSDELRALSENLYKKSKLLKEYSDECTCLRCRRSCGGCGCNDSSCYCNCLDNRDLCPHRNEMENLRNNILPSIVDDMNKKRDEIYAFIHGDDPSGNFPHFNQNITPKFLSFEEAMIRYNGLKQELNNDLDDLQEAEELVKFPSFVKRLNLAQYLEKKLLKKLEKQDFKNFSPLGYDSVDRYCKIFNCSNSNGELCNKYKLNNDDVLCNLFNIDGAPATFYHSIKEYEKHK